MKRLSTLLAISILTAACASTPASVNDNGSSGSGSSMRKADATHYRLLSDPRTVREIEWSRPPLDLHVKGRMTTAGFEPLSQVEGSGRLCADGKDWVNLKDGIFHSASEGATPQGPYIQGCKSRTGGFVPASKEISNG